MVVPFIGKEGILNCGRVQGVSKQSVLQGWECLIDGGGGHMGYSYLLNYIYLLNYKFLLPTCLYVNSST